MLAASNTTPISSLALIGRLSLLQSQFTEVWVPASVLAELSAHPDTAVRAAIQEAVDAGWIKCGPVVESLLVNLLSLHLHSGEADTIALAAELSSPVVILDEQEGRKLAARVGLQVTGVLGILLRAKRDGQIPAVKPEIQSLRKQGNFFIAPPLEALVLAAAGE
jgi:uncharacterized protein